MKKVIVIGAVFVDIKGYPDGIFNPAGRNAGRVETVHGGVARNIAEDIANMELRPTFVSLVDGTGEGKAVIEKLARHRVETGYIREVPDGMGTWLAVFDSAGDVAASVSKRPDLSPIGDILAEKGDEIFDGAAGVLIETDMDKDIVRRVITLAKKHGAIICGAVSNMSIAAARRDMIKEMDLFVCNREEAGILFSEEYGEKSAEEMRKTAAENAAKAEFPLLVITLGAEGAVYGTRDGRSGFCPAMRVIAADTTGAGDAFFAGVSAGLCYGKNVDEACGIGSRLAASVISTTDNVCPRFLPSEFGIEAEE